MGGRGAIQKYAARLCPLYYFSGASAYAFDSSRDGRSLCWGVFINLRKNVCSALSTFVIVEKYAAGIKM